MGRAALAGLVVAGVVFAVLVLAGGEDDRPEGRAPAAAATTRGADVFARMACGSCHRLAAARSVGRIGPDLDTSISRHTRASLRRKIVDPKAGQGFSAMPDDFGERMSGTELNALLDFLLAAGS